jgi:hypothetical protein
MADLVKADYHVSRGVKPGNAGSLADIHANASLFVETRSDLYRKLVMRVASKGRIDTVEREVTFGRVDDDAAVRDGDGLGRSIDTIDIGRFQLFLVF